MFSEDDSRSRLRFAAHEADGFGGHDFVGGFVFDHAVLVDSGFVLKGVGADDGFVGLAFHSGVFSDHFGGGGDVSNLGLWKD